MSVVDRMRDLLVAQDTPTLLGALEAVEDGTLDAESARLTIAIASAELVRRVAAEHGDAKADQVKVDALALATATASPAALATYWRSLPLLGSAR